MEFGPQWGNSKPSLSSVISSHHLLIPGNRSPVSLHRDNRGSVVVGAVSQAGAGLDCIRLMVCGGRHRRPEKPAAGFTATCQRLTRGRENIRSKKGRLKIEADEVVSLSALPHLLFQHQMLTQGEANFTPEHRTNMKAQVFLLTADYPSHSVFLDLISFSLLLFSHFFFYFCVLQLWEQLNTCGWSGSSRRIFFSGLLLHLISFYWQILSEKVQHIKLRVKYRVITELSTLTSLK